MPVNTASNKSLESQELLTQLERRSPGLAEFIFGNAANPESENGIQLSSLEQRSIENNLNIARNLIGQQGTSTDENSLLTLIYETSRAFSADFGSSANRAAESRIDTLAERAATQIDFLSLRGYSVLDFDDRTPATNLATFLSTYRAAASNGSISAIERARLVQLAANSLGLNGVGELDELRSSQGGGTAKDSVYPEIADAHAELTAAIQEISNYQAPAETANPLISGVSRVYPGPAGGQGNDNLVSPAATVDPFQSGDGLGAVEFSNTSVTSAGLRTFIGSSGTHAVRLNTEVSETSQENYERLLSNATSLDDIFDNPEEVNVVQLTDGSITYLGNIDGKYSGLTVRSRQTADVQPAGSREGDANTPVGGEVNDDLRSALGPPSVDGDDSDDTDAGIADSRAPSEIELSDVNTQDVYVRGDGTGIALGSVNSGGRFLLEVEGNNVSQSEVEALLNPGTSEAGSLLQLAGDPSSVTSFSNGRSVIRWRTTNDGGEDRTIQLTLTAQTATVRPGDDGVNRISTGDPDVSFIPEGPFPPVIVDTISEDETGPPVISGRLGFERFELTIARQDGSAPSPAQVRQVRDDLESSSRQAPFDEIFATIERQDSADEQTRRFTGTTPDGLQLTLVFTDIDTTSAPAPEEPDTRGTETSYEGEFAFSTVTIEADGPTSAENLFVTLGSAGNISDVFLGEYTITELSEDSWTFTGELHDGTVATITIDQKEFDEPDGNVA